MTPLFLTEEELKSSSALFPLEFLEIQEQHRVLGGRDPFVGFHVDTSRLKDAVVQGLPATCFAFDSDMSKAAGANDAITILLPLSITSTIPLLRGVQRVLDCPVLTHSDAVIKDIAEQLQFDLQGLLDVLLLKRGQISPGPSEVPRFFDRYLQASTRTCRGSDAGSATMTRLLSITILFCLSLPDLCASASPYERPKIKLPDPMGYVSDHAKVLDDDWKERIRSVCQDLGAKDRRGDGRGYRADHQAVRVGQRVCDGPL